MTLAEVLTRSASQHGGRPAVTDVRTGQSIRYDALAREAERVTAFLGAQGVGPGHRIAVASPNDIAYLPAAFGLLATGACLVPLAANLAAPELAAVLDEVNVNGSFSAAGADAALGSGERAVLSDGACKDFRFAWIDRDAEGPPDLQQLDPAFIRFTSGTTARSKGVVLSHAATLARVEAADHVLKFTPEDRIIWVLPLAYHFAVTIVAYVKAGAHILMCPDTLPRAVVDAAQRLEGSVLYASPFHFERLGNLGRTDALKRLRLALSTSAPISAEVMRRFEEASGIPVAQAYGIIEAGLPCINVRSDGLAPTSVGHPVPGYDVAVFSDEGVRVGPHVSGEIAVRGGGLFSAYYAPWQPREQVMRDGWFFTGDVGHLDESGALHLEGRKKSVIFVAGVKFFPEEVEHCLNRFPGIRESRVVGRPHARLGQVPHAEIVLDTSACDLAALRAHCARELSAYKVPLEFTVVPAIEKTPGGKIARR